MTKSRFEHIFKHGQPFRGGAVRALVCLGTGEIGFATTRAIGCHARRNRVKRRVREACRNVMVPLSYGMLDLVIVAKSECNDLSWNELVSGVAQLNERILAAFPAPSALD